MTTPSAWTVRALQAEDRGAWEVVWQQYLDFYGQFVPDDVSDLANATAGATSSGSPSRATHGHAACTTASRR